MPRENLAPREGAPRSCPWASIWSGTRLVALTHTPSPMGFLRDILGQPRNERPYVLIPVGYPAPDCRVPDLQRKSLDEIMVRV